jgi:lysozyme
VNPSPACFALIRASEGCVLKSYRDNGGVLTCGWGHTGPDVREGETITPEQAEQLLEADAAKAGAAVCRLAPKTTQGQFDALTDFVFNLGVGALAGSTLLHKHNAGDFAGAAAEFGKWVYAADRILPGLVKRRAAEAALYLCE